MDANDYDWNEETTEYRQLKKSAKRELRRFSSQEDTKGLKRISVIKDFPESRSVSLSLSLSLSIPRLTQETVSRLISRILGNTPTPSQVLMTDHVKCCTNTKIIDRKKDFQLRGHDLLEWQTLLVNKNTPRYPLLFPLNAWLLVSNAFHILQEMMLTSMAGETSCYCPNKQAKTIKSFMFQEKVSRVTFVS
jgi:hypothetical protein